VPKVLVAGPFQNVVSVPPHGRRGCILWPCSPMVERVKSAI
jgi:hypothetical protein